MYYNIILDTVDLLYDFCTTYICNNNNADTLADIPYGRGYGMVEKEFDSALRQIVQMGYGLVMISHEADKSFTDENGQQFNKIVPTLDKRGNNIVARMADIIMYTRSVTDENGTNKVMAFCRGTTRFEAGSRFKYFPDYFELSYKNLVTAINDAINKQEEEDGSELFTDERQNNYIDTTTHLDYDELMAEFQTLIASIPGFSATPGSEEEKEFQRYWQPRITQIIEKYLGKGAKITNSNRSQTEAIDLIVAELKEVLAEKGKDKK